jgi:hypothetical protein
MMIQINGMWTQRQNKNKMFWSVQTVTGMVNNDVQERILILIGECGYKTSAFEPTTYVML